MQVFHRVSEEVESLPGAWAFVMSCVDRFVSPNIEIQAVTPGEGEPYYSVTVYGTVM